MLEPGPSESCAFTTRGRDPQPGGLRQRARALFCGDRRFASSAQCSRRGCSSLISAVIGSSPQEQDGEFRNLVWTTSLIEGQGGERLLPIRIEGAKSDRHDPRGSNLLEAIPDCAKPLVRSS